MHDAALEGAARDQLRAALHSSVASIVWTTVANSAAVLLGLRAGSIVLVAFGMTGLLDAAGSVSLVVHFRHALHHEAFSERHERMSLRVVTLGLLTVGIVTLLASAQRLATHADTSASALGTAVAALSIVVLAVLSCWKRQVARRVGSRALEADSWLSATGCLLGIVTVLGTVLAAELAWWWADPIAAGAIGVTAIIIANLMRRGAQPKRV